MDKTGSNYTYDSKGNVISAKDNSNNNENYTIDSSNRLTGVKDKENNNYTYTYNADDATKGTTSHQVQTAVESTNKQKFEFLYDTHGNITRVKQKHSEKSESTVCPIQTNSTYSSNGDRKLTDTDTMRSVTSYGYSGTNSNDLRLYSTTKNGHSVNYTYKPNTNIVNGITISFTDAAGTVKQVSNGYTFTKDRLTAVTHNGFNYNMQYDLFGNRTTTLLGNIPLITNLFAAANGLLLRSTYGNGQYVENVYDRYDRITSKKYNGVEKFKYEYDSNGCVSKYEEIEDANNKKLILILMTCLADCKKQMRRTEAV